MSRKSIGVAVAVLAVLASALPVPAAEWPHWGGPGRDFSADAPRLADSWDGEPPQVVWRRPLGNGRSAIVVDGRTLYTMFGGKKRETVVALDASSGEIRWRHTYAVGYEPHAYDGPHATPAIAEDRLITVSIDAKVHALDLRTGKVLWFRDLVAEHDVDLPQFGYAASPLVHEGRVLLPGLGEPGPGVLALDLEDGKTAWARHEFRSSHASPILIRFNERSQAIFHGMDWLYSLDPVNGDVLWRERVRTDAFDNVSFTPLWDAVRERLIVSHGYDDFGAQAIRLEQVEGKMSATKNWNNRRLNVDHGNAVLLDGVMYGSHRSDPALLVAVDLDDGALRWRVRMPKATFLRVDGKLLLLDEEGTLYQATPDADEPGIVGQLSVLDSQAWTVPTVVGNRVYLRDGKQVIALDLPLAEAPAVRPSD